MINNKFFGCYLHIPFCKNKCSYCDYYSLTDHSKLLSKYISSLLQEIKLKGRKLSTSRELTTIYFGGGTPSILSPVQFQRLLSALAENFSFISSGPEITMEVNPLDLQDGCTLQAWKKTGINRFSLGVQSLISEELNLLGREHNREQALQALEILQNQNVNYGVDLIYGLPRQSPTSFFFSLERTLDYNPRHISVYNLEVKPETPLKAEVDENKLEIMSEKKQAEIFSHLPEKLRQENFINYEIANYARPGYQCQHNLYYWKCLNYLGFGPGAHWFWQGSRNKNRCDLIKYIENLEQDKLPPNQEKNLTGPEAITEFMIMGLRLKWGIIIDEFESRFSKSIFYYFAEEIERLIQENLLLQQQGRIFLSRRGRKYGNYVFRQFII